MIEKLGQFTLERCLQALSVILLWPWIRIKILRSRELRDYQVPAHKYLHPRSPIKFFSSIIDYFYSILESSRAISSTRIRIYSLRVQCSCPLIISSLIPSSRWVKLGQSAFPSHWHPSSPIYITLETLCFY